MTTITGYRTILCIVLLVTGLTLFPAAAARAATLSELAKEFICQCGCTLVLDSCTHAECHSKTQMTALLQQKIDEGLPPAEITALFVRQYGEQVLASPPKKGFNLTAWLLPFAAILAGAALVYIMLRKWVRQGNRPRPGAAAPPPAETDDPYARRLERELRDFGEKGFR